MEKIITMIKQTDTMPIVIDDKAEKVSFMEVKIDASQHRLNLVTIEEEDMDGQDETQDGFPVSESQTLPQTTPKSTVETVVTQEAMLNQQDKQPNFSKHSTDHQSESSEDLKEISAQQLIQDLYAKIVDLESALSLEKDTSAFLARRVNDIDEKNQEIEKQRVRKEKEKAKFNQENNTESAIAERDRMSKLVWSV
jgi:hypothetical protein